MKYNEDMQHETVVPFEIITSTAACADDDTKYNIKITCKYLNRVISLDNINFVSHPLFSINEKKLHKIIIVNSWKQNLPMMNALRCHLRKDTVIIPDYTQCDTHGTHIHGFDRRLSIEIPSQLYKKYIIDEIDFSQLIKGDIDLAMYCAVLSNDIAAIKKLTPIIWQLYANTHAYGKWAVQRSLLNLTIKKGNEEAFECIVEYDPFSVKNYFGTYDRTYLDDLNDYGRRNITEEESKKYGALYKKHGGKTYKELNPSCIIS